MPPPEKKSGWAGLSLAFDKIETVPQRGAKRALSPDDKLFKMPDVCAFPRRNNITSLSELIAACNPTKASDLSVSKQKQKEISEWFANQVHPGKAKVLVLSGPSGCGKSASLKVIAKENDYEVIEWTTPADAVSYETFTSTRQSDKFLDFLIRATRYNSVFQTARRRLLLVKDIPNVYLIKHDSFFTMLENYFQYGKEPLVFVCTDGGSSRMLKNLFPTDIRSRFNIDVISVPASTQAAMKNMLKRVSVILNSQGSHILNVTQNSIEEVISNSIGDVRSAILNLIFNSLKVPDNKFKHDCGTREVSLGLLHGIGRVINPKRVQDGDGWKFVHDPDEIASYFLSQSTVFLHFLHENYMNTMGSIEEIQECADIMSLSDTIAYEWRDLNLTKVNLSFCVRGIMVNNKKPVSGWNPVRKPCSEEIKVPRDLGIAEERWYKSIICPQVPQNLANLDNTVIENCDS